MNGRGSTKVRRLYIAGPYSAGDTMLNVALALRAADRALELGWLPFVPHLTGFWHFHSPKPWTEWLDIDLAWLDVCDAVLRLPGASAGADLEVERAHALGLPVYQGLERLPHASALGAMQRPRPAR